MQSFLSAVATRATDARGAAGHQRGAALSDAAPLTSLSALLSELGLPPSSSSSLTLDACAGTLHASGRPALLRLLQGKGFVAGHAQKIATALARSLRSGRLALNGSAVVPAPPSVAAAAPPSVGAMLQAAAASGDAAQVATILAESTPTHGMSSSNLTTAVIGAARRGHGDCVVVLLSHGAAPDGVGADGCTPLHVACRRGHAAVVRALLTARASASLAVRGGSVPLHAASWGGHSVLVEMLCAANADANASRPDGSRPLMDAVQQGHAPCAATLLARGALADARMHHGWTALLVAALHGRASCVRLLCERAAKGYVDEADVDGSTALYVGAAEPTPTCPLPECHSAADRECPVC